jgi:hypothetical protein
VKARLKSNQPVLLSGLRRFVKYLLVKLIFRCCCHAAIQLDSVLWEVALASLSPLLPADPIPIIKHVAHVSKQACHWIAHMDGREVFSIFLTVPLIMCMAWNGTGVGYVRLTRCQLRNLPSYCNSSRSRH